MGDESLRREKSRSIPYVVVEEEGEGEGNGSGVTELAQEWRNNGLGE